MAAKTIQIADKPTVDEILALLENAEVGLAALRLLLGNSADATTMNAVKGILENGTYGLNALDKDLGTITNYLANSTYGLAALKNAITGRANETTVAAVKALLENGTYGLNALKTAVGSSNKFSSTTAGVLQINSEVLQIGLDAAKRKVFAAYSPEISISGNGQIVFYDTNKFSPSPLSVHCTKLVDMVIDGCAVPTSKTTNSSVDAFTLYANASNSSASMLFSRKIEFGKSFKCKLGYFGAVNDGYSVDVTCTATANYYVQLR